MSALRDGDREALKRHAAVAAAPPPTPEDMAWIRRLRRVLKDQPTALYLVPCLDSFMVVKDHGNVAAPVESVNARLRDG